MIEDIEEVMQKNRLTEYPYACVDIRNLHSRFTNRIQIWSRARDFAEKYVRDHEQDLRTRYGSAYLAITEDNGVIDYDNDRTNLLARVFADGLDYIIINTIDNLINVANVPATGVVI